jgi:CheY-like chemotaxis protein/anti-sigma regulatory factor (Ser/Thr protein kinase)
MIRLLVVDDEPLNLLIMTESLSEDGYQIDEAGDGEEAWTMMQKQRYDVLILDRMMPRLDGLSLLKRAKADPAWRHVPAIMQTAAASQQQVREGMAAGAYYYLTKPYESATLRTLVRTVVEDLQERARLRETGTRLQTTLALLSQGEFVFRTLKEARDIATTLSGLCRDGSGSSMGLVALLVNAVEHGNLGITYAEKSRLRQTFEWENEIERRLNSELYARRRGRIALRRDGNEIEFTISDEGEGFDWLPYLQLDPDRAFDLNGRGIAMANMLGFSSLEYQGAGNIVVARAEAIRQPPPLQAAPIGDLQGACPESQ